MFSYRHTGPFLLSRTYIFLSTKNCLGMSSVPAQDFIIVVNILYIQHETQTPFMIGITPNICSFILEHLCVRNSGMFFKVIPSLQLMKEKNK